MLIKKKKQFNYVYHYSILKCQHHRDPIGKHLI